MEPGNAGMIPVCGRCRDSFNHEWNHKFRWILKLNLPKYRVTKTRREISQLVAEVPHFLMEDTGARFLEKREKAWIELEFQEAKKKVGHALRDTKAITAFNNDRQA
jgi:hypothetical protein